MDLVGGGRVLDQLHQPVAQHHLASRDGHIAPWLECFGTCRRLVCDLGLQVFHQVLQAAHQIRPALFEGTLLNNRVGGKEVRGRTHIQPLLAPEPDQACVMRFNPGNALAGSLPPALLSGEARTDGIERPLLPLSRLEEAIGLCVPGPAIAKTGPFFQRQPRKIQTLSGADGKMASPVQPGLPLGLGETDSHCCAHIARTA